jgi:hypothetical protein
VERGLLPEEYGGWYDHEIIHELQHMSKLVHENPLHGDFLNIHDFADTLERFYTPIAQSMSLLADNIDGGDVNVSEGMKFSAQRDGTFGIPFTPILDCECDLMLQRIAVFSRNSSTRSNLLCRC